MLDCIVVDVASETAAELAVCIAGSVLAHVIVGTVVAHALVDWEVGLAGIDLDKAAGTSGLEVGLAGTAADTFDSEAGLAGTAADTFGLEADLAASIVAHPAPDMARHLCRSNHLPGDGGGDAGSSWVAARGNSEE
jgi:hypothetical protein